MEAAPWIYKINLCEEVSRMTLEKRFEQEMINIYTTAKKNAATMPPASFN